MKRVLLIGLDGAEPSLVEPWMDSGVLPNLAGLRDRGAYLRMASTRPPATFPAWTTCVTGVNPGRHGILDFTEMIQGQYALRFVNSTFRRAPALWNILSAAGKRVGVLGVPATYPPEPVSGFMVSGFDSPVCTGVDRSFVFPEDLYPEVREWTFADFQEHDIGAGWHDMAFEKLMAKVAVKERIAVDLFRKESWDFFMVVFGESDTVAHHFWMFYDPNSPRHRPGHENAIQRVYRRLDEAVGALLAACGDDVVVGVVSDHGFGGAGTGVVHLNNWLSENGYLHVLPGSRNPLKEAALRFTPEAWRGTLFRRFQGLASKTEGRSRFGGIDWGRTTAWSEELNYFPSIRVNLKGREPQGRVEPGEYDVFCAELCKKIEQWFPVASARPRGKIYDGPHVDRAPDIILELALENGYSHSCLRSRGGESFRRIRPDEYLGGKEKGMNGNHRDTGVFFVSEPVMAGAASIEDIAPTVLAAMEVPAPPMDGTSLLEGGLAVAADMKVRLECAYSPEQQRVIEKRLRDLGYFE